MQRLKSCKGFTLIELLIIIVIIGIICAGIWTVLDPMEKFKNTNDSKVQASIAQIANAMEAYATSHEGIYPDNFDALITSGNLKNIPDSPSGYSAYSLGAGGTSQEICGELKSKKYLTTPNWLWCSSTGRSGPNVDCVTCP